VIAFAPDDSAEVALVEAELRALAPTLPWERVLIGPVREILSRPSKRFRANLVEIGYRLAGGKGAPPSGYAAAIELLHAGSLVIDDIEDDAVERRGGPALHRSHGVPVALNAGNWMCFFALSLVEGPAQAAMMRAILDCHRGQALDVGCDVTAVPRHELRALVASATALKAGALTRLAAELGAIAADGDVVSTGGFGAALGVALQMLDDLGLAKRPEKAREDLWALRPTWAWVWASEAFDDASWARATRWARQIASKRSDAAPIATLLSDVAQARGRAEIRGQLAAARAAVEGLPGATLADAELARLEISYG